MVKAPQAPANIDEYTSAAPAAVRPIFEGDSECHPRGGPRRER